MAQGDRIGFEIGSQFFPMVSIDAWRNGDFILARELTRLTPERLFSDETDYLTLQQALIAVAVWNKRPTLKLERVIDYVYALKPGDVTEVGFETPVEGDAGPPAGTPGEATPSSSSPTSGEASDAAPES